MYRLFFLLLLSTVSCTSNKKILSDLVITTPTPREISFEKKLENAFSYDPVWKNHLVGFVLADTNGKELININGHKYFTPASNAKLLTYYIALKTLDSLEAIIEYAETDHALYFRGTAHPALLHPDLPLADKTLELLKKTKKTLIYAPQNFQDESYNPGWALDDINLAYQTDKSSLALFGNTFLITKPKDSVKYTTIPKALERFIHSTDKKRTNPYRDINSNTIYVSESISHNSSVKKRIPFISSPELITQILEDELGKSVLTGKTDVVYKALKTYPTAPLYKKLLLHSDNHIAEQLLLMSAYKLTDTFNTKRIIDYSLENIFSDIPDKPRWVDGSGLSRYNLMTPRSIVWTLNKIKEEASLDSLKKYLPSIRLSSEGPQAYVKTGSLSNNYNLSGYLTCQSGKTYTFSFMNNHYMIERKELITELKKILLNVYQRY